MAPAAAAAESVEMPKAFLLSARRQHDQLNDLVEKHYMVEPVSSKKKFEAHPNLQRMAVMAASVAGLASLQAECAVATTELKKA
jgi:hypothetical protein